MTSLTKGPEDIRMFLETVISDGCETKTAMIVRECLIAALDRS